eukprot:14940943-Alexandrium_andersonii.AAC.1
MDQGIIATLRRCIYDHIACRSGSGAPGRQEACWHVLARLGGTPASPARCVPGRRPTGKRPLPLCWRTLRSGPCLRLGPSRAASAQGGRPWAHRM